MTEIMDTLVLNNPLSAYVAAALCVAGGVLAGLCAGHTAGAVIRTMFAGRRLEKSFRRLVEKPIAILFFYIGFRVGLGQLAFSGAWETWKTRLLDAVFIVIVCWSLARLIDEIILRMGRGGAGEKAGAAHPHAAVRPLLRKTLSFVMILVPFILVLKALGYDISALLAGIGIGSAAIALSARDMLSNFFGTASIFADKSFGINDRVKVAGVEGYIVDMRLRSSRLKTLDNRIVTVPNSLFQNSLIENVSSEPHTRVVNMVSIRASNGFEKARRACELLRGLDVGAAGENGRPPVALGDRCMATFWSVGIHVFKIHFMFFIAKGADYWATISAVNLEVLRLFEEAGIEL